MCGIYYCIVCTSNLNLVSASFLCQPYIKCRGCCRFVHMHKKAIVHYSIVLCCGMYEEYCLPTNCDNVVSCIKTLSLCRLPCVSVLPLLR